MNERYNDGILYRWFVWDFTWLAKESWHDSQVSTGRAGVRTCGSDRVHSHVSVECCNSTRINRSL